MPEPIGSSWADEIEEGDTSTLPPISEKISGNSKIVTSFHFNDEKKKVKTVSTYRIDKKLVSRNIAHRKAWSKFGESKNDRPGPDPATTIMAEETFMQFVANKDDAEKDADSSDIKTKLEGKSMLKCRICKEDHWTTQCPYKDTLAPLQEALGLGTQDSEKDKPATGGAGPGGAPPATSGPPGVTGGKYVPPSKRGEGGARERIGESMPDRKRNIDDTAAIRVSNLSENTQDTDLQELFKPFGQIARIFLSKDKQTGVCKGFGFINYVRKDDAARAIAHLNGYGYDHLILNVEWAKQSGT